MNIDYDRLLASIKDSILESEWGRYNFDSILSNATVINDGTNILVKSNDFNMIFDKISYELISYEGFDVK